MSDYQVGPGWWQASDERWYPPYLHPDPVSSIPAEETARSDETGSSAGRAESSPGSSEGAGRRHMPRPETRGWEESWHPAEPAGTGSATDRPDLVLPVPTPSRQGPRARRRNRLVVLGVALLVGVLLAVFLVPLTGRAHTAPPPPSTAAAGGGTRASTPTSPVDGATMLSARLTKGVVGRVWPAFIEADTSRSLASLTSVASPYVVEVVESFWMCGCGTWPLAYSSLEITAPPESDYPLSFLAELDQPADPYGAAVQLVVFTQRSAHAPWLITNITGYGGLNRSLSERFDFSGSLDPLTPGTESFVELAQMFASLRQSGRPPAGDLWTDTLDQGNLLPSPEETKYYDTYRNDVAAKFRPSATFSALAYSPVYATGNGALQCATILGRVKVKPRPGHTIVQPRADFIGLNPGRYSSVTELTAMDVCMLRPSAQQVDVISLAGGTFLVVGARIR